jgi:hypothetical protein
MITVILVLFFVGVCVHLNNQKQKLKEQLEVNELKYLEAEHSYKKEKEKLRQAELKWLEELNAYQLTVDNLKLKLEASTTILPELKKVVEDSVQEIKPKRQRKSK